MTEAKMKVSVIGLGNMGAALARALLAQGLAVTVWNRTTAKSEPLRAAGAVIVDSAQAAVSASPVTILCMTDMAASKTLIQTPEFAEALAGNTIVDLSTGTANDARSAEKSIATAGGRYLDGGVLCYPRDIGTSNARILYAGKTSVFADHKAILAAIGGSQDFVGDDAGAAATTYLALWSFYFGALIAYFEAGALGAAAGIPLEHFKNMSQAMLDKLSDGMADATDRVIARNFAGDQAQVEVYIDNELLVRDVFSYEKVSHLTVNAFLELLQAARAAGDGDKDIAVLFDRIIPR